MKVTVKINGAAGVNYAVDSKSDAHRALICAALCHGETTVTVAQINNDIEATARCLSALGAVVQRTRNGYFIKGRAIGGGVLDCGESGSTARFLIPVSAALGRETTFVGFGKLPERPMLPLTACLRDKGCEINGDYLPIRVSGACAGGRYVVPGNVSSQFISGLLMALPLTGEKCEILTSTPLQSELYADMTVATLSRFGVRWEKLTPENSFGYYGGYKLITEPKGNVCSVGCSENGDTYTTDGVYTVEGDWSGAAFFVALAALSGEITVYGLDESSLQPDKAMIGVLRSFGAYAEFTDGALKVKMGEAKPFSVDVSQFPDIFPILAVLACGAKGESLLYNAARLRIKESDRIETTAALIRSLGGRVEIFDDGMRIFGTGTLEGGEVDGSKDHRIVMSAAVAASICKNEVIIKGAEAVEKSYPTFFDALEKVGGIVRCDPVSEKI